MPCAGQDNLYLTFRMYRGAITQKGNGRAEPDIVAITCLREWEDFTRTSRQRGQGVTVSDPADTVHYSQIIPHCP